MPKTLVQPLKAPQDSEQVQQVKQDRLSYARHMYESRNGGANFLKQLRQDLAEQAGVVQLEQAKKLFTFINRAKQRSSDYSDTRVVSKHQIRLLIQYCKCELDEDKAKGQNELMRRLAKMLLVPDVKVFDECLFAHFFMAKGPTGAHKANPPSILKRAGVHSHTGSYANIHSGSAVARDPETSTLATMSAPRTKESPNHLTAAAGSFFDRRAAANSNQTMLSTIHMVTRPNERTFSDSRAGANLSRHAVTANAPRPLASRQQFGAHYQSGLSPQVGAQPAKDNKNQVTFKNLLPPKAQAAQRKHEVKAALPAKEDPVVKEFLNKDLPGLSKDYSENVKAIYDVKRAKKATHQQLEEVNKM